MSSTLLSSGVKIRTGLKNPNVVVYVGLIDVSAGSSCGVCRHPVPGVVKSEPRLGWKPVKGVGTAEDVTAPPPSHLISRRPLGRGPAALPLFGLPSAARKASTVGWIDAVALEPPTENVTNAAVEIEARPSATQAIATCRRSMFMESPCLRPRRFGR